MHRITLSIAAMYSSILAFPARPPAKTRRPYPFGGVTSGARWGRRVSDFTGSQSSPFLLVDRFRDLLFFIHSIGRRPTGGSPLSPGAGQQSSRRILFRVYHRKNDSALPPVILLLNRDRDMRKNELLTNYSSKFVRIRQNSPEFANMENSRKSEKF